MHSPLLFRSVILDVAIALAFASRVAALDGTPQEGERPESVLPENAGFEDPDPLRAWKTWI